MITLDALLVEAATFQTRLTAEVHIDSLEQRLKNSMRPLSLDDVEPFSDVCTSSGIYCFEARFPFSTFDELEDFGTRWGRAKGKNGPMGSSRYYIGRAIRHKERIGKNEFIPFYLGKEKNVMSRLNGHLTGAEEATTYSLKLKMRAEMLAGIDFRFGFVEIPVDSNAFFCLALLEKALRNRINPIIGRQ